MSDQLKSVGVTQTSSFGNVNTYIPDSLRFRQTKQGLACRRVPVKFRSDQQSYNTASNRLIQIRLPNNALYDTRPGYLTFTLAISNTNGTYARIHQGVFSIFNRLRMMCGSTAVEDLRDYARIYSAQWEMLNPSLVTGNIGNVMGFGTQLERNAKGATSTEYACPLMSGVLNTELLPFDNLSEGMVLELYLDDTTTYIESDSTLVPVVTVSNIMFHMERLDIDPSFRSFLKADVQANGLNLGWQTWERYQFLMPTGTRQNINITHKSSSVNGMFHFLLNSANFNNMTVNDKYLDWTPLTLTQANVVINGTVFPDEPVDCSFAQRIEPYQMYCRWLNKWKLNGILAIAPPITQQAFATDRFIIIDDLEPYPEAMDIINPFSTLGNNATITKQLTFSALTPANYQLDTWVEYFRQAIIKSNGLVVISQ
jgi:hypothetical protein